MYIYTYVSTYSFVGFQTNIPGCRIAEDDWQGAAEVAAGLPGHLGLRRRTRNSRGWLMITE